MAVKKAVTKAKAKTTKKVAPSAKHNQGVRDAEAKMSAKDNFLKRVGARIGATKEQSDMIAMAVFASLEETVVVKGTFNYPAFAKAEVVTKKASEGTIQFGERKGEKWTKAEHQAIKISNINGVWTQRANDEEDIIPIDEIEEIWGDGAEADEDTEAEDVADEEVEDEEEDEEEEEAPAPKKKTPAKKAPAKKPTAKK
jgi:hypothetical protein